MNADTINVQISVLKMTNIKNICKNSQLNVKNAKFGRLKTASKSGMKAFSKKKHIFIDKCI